MQLSEKANIAFVYSITTHQYLGLVIEPFLVEVTAMGNFSLSHQRLISSNAAQYKHLLGEHDLKILHILEEITAEKLVKRFYRKGTIRPKEYFEKKCDEATFKQSIRPFIERRLVEALELIDKDKLYFANQTKNVTATKLTYCDENVSVLFHFNRNETETRYYATLKCNNERLKLLGTSHLLTLQPAVLIVDNKLVLLPDVDGKKLEPFLTKYYIAVARRSEEIFFKKFGLELIEKFNVKAEGFEILQENHKASAILKLEHSIGNKYVFILSFKYDGQVFPYHSKKMAHAIYEQKGDGFYFRKIRRSRDWEEHKREFIESLGLAQLEGSAFVIAEGTRIFDYETDINSDKYRAIEWLDANQNALTGRGFEIVQNMNGGTYFLGEKNIRVEIDKKSDWFDIQTKIWFGEYEISFLSLKPYILSGNREYKLPDGNLVLIPEAWMTRFAGILRYNEGTDTLRLKNMHWGLLGSFANTAGIETRLQGLLSFEKIEEKPLPKGFKGHLRDYQVAGYNWFYFLQEFGFGGCLADDMGLGKTIQTLALLQNEKEQAPESRDFTVSESEAKKSKTAEQINLFDAPMVKDYVSKAKVTRTSLLIVPTSLIFNWINEAAKFTPDLKVFVHIGQNRLKANTHFEDYDLIISTYGTVRNDETLFVNFGFHYIILDESQNIKNPHSRTFTTLRSLHAAHRLTLTGTPVENTIKDLWSQISFTNPGLLGGLKFFEDTYVIPVEKENNQEKMAELRTLIKPFILRRTKQQVASELPEKSEQILYCDMTPEQETYYEETKSAFRNEILTSIEGVGFNKARFSIIAGLTKLRQIANHPNLVKSDFEGSSGKFMELLSRTRTAIESGHKILIYSQFVEQLKIIRTAFDAEEIHYCYFDGSYSAAERQKQVQIFQTTPEIPVFLVSLRAGGVGLTLTAADYVFVVDPWWNPSIERQAVDRTHRIGQTKNIFSYKFITKNSVEEKILNLQEKKLHLASELVVTEDSFYKRLDISDIKKILE
jgi:SNF2 family DNA or RNA helicase